MTNELKITVPKEWKLIQKILLLNVSNSNQLIFVLKVEKNIFKKNSEDKDFVEKVGSCLGELEPNSLFYLKVKAFLKLKLLRDAWVTKKDCKQVKEYSYYVLHYTGARWISANSNLRGIGHDILSFPTGEMYREFIICFKDLLDQTL